jgi:hypothetical protein
MIWDIANPGYTNGGAFRVVSLPAGSFVARMEGQTDAGITLTVSGAHISVFQLGG